MLTEFAAPGLHDQVSRLIPTAKPETRAIELGAGAGAMTHRLKSKGWDVLAVDIDLSHFVANAPTLEADLNEPLPVDGPFDLVLSLEVIEHLERPMELLRTIRHLLADDGLAILTTPNMDSLVAKLKLLMKGTLRSMDKWGDPTHITPIFWDMLQSKYLPAAGLRILDYEPFPRAGAVMGNPIYRPALRVLDRIAKAPLVGDLHIFTLGLL